MKSNQNSLLVRHNYIPMRALRFLFHIPKVQGTHQTHARYYMRMFSQQGACCHSPSKPRQLQADHVEDLFF